LRIFISGLKRNLTDVLFAAQPKVMPSALALAQEVESNHERYIFAACFAKSQEDKDRKNTAKAQGRQLEKYDHHDPQPNNTKNPYFYRQHKIHADPQNAKNYKNNGSPEPMEVDSLFSKLLQPTHANGYQTSHL